MYTKLFITDSYLNQEKKSISIHIKLILIPSYNRIDQISLIHSNVRSTISKRNIEDICK